MRRPLVSLLVLAVIVGFSLEAIAFAADSIPLFLIGLAVLAAPLAAAVTAGLRAQRRPTVR